MGTHNALLRLGERVYLEIIAIDPDGTKPPRPRWFDLDDIALQAELTERPQLVHWVARTDDIERSAAASPVPLGAITPMERGDYRWRITIPDDGKRPGKGIVPDADPVGRADASGRPAAGVERRDRAARGRAFGSGAGASGARRARPRRRVQVTYDRNTRLAAMLRTPRGVVTSSDQPSAPRAATGHRHSTRVPRTPTIQS